MTQVTMTSVLLDQCNLSDSAGGVLDKLESSLLDMMAKDTLTLKQCIDKVRWMCIKNASDTGYYDINGKMKYIATAWYDSMAKHLNEENIETANNKTDSDLTNEDEKRIEDYFISLNYLN